MHYLPKAPYVLTIRRGSNEVFIICLELSRFITTGTLRYAIRIPRDTFSTRLINIPEQRHNQRTVSDRGAQIRNIHYRSKMVRLLIIKEALN